MNKFLTSLIVTALWSSAALSQEPAWNDIKGEELAALQAKGDASRGETAFVPCQGCHRRDASGRTSGAYPRLSGQHATVLIKQIADIRAGRRINPKMEPFIDDHAMTPYQIADIAAYLQSLPIGSENGRGPGDAAGAGKKIYDKDCATCHGANGEGNAEKFYPMVAAQHFKYLLREEHMIKDGERRNANPKMVTVIKPHGDADLEALADYMSRLPAPTK